MKVLVAHPAQQHSYRTAVALKKEGMLFKYATTVYNKRHSITSLVSKLLHGKLQAKAAARQCDDLTDLEVIQFCEIWGLWKLCAIHVPFIRKYYYRIKYATADRFAKKVARYAIKNRVDAVITYDDSSPILFEILKEKAPNIVRILDVSIANQLYMKKIFEHDFGLAPKFADRLKREMPYVWNEMNIDRAQREIATTDYFLVASDFVKKSLQYSGVTDDQFLVCPYGVDTDLFAVKEYLPFGSVSRPIKFIYVGGVKERKGIYYLLEAFKRIPADKAVLTVVGSADLNDADMREYSGCAQFTGVVLHSEVPKLLRDSDVFIFPSLAEGMTLSALEAAACGLPLIVTENTGVNDCMVDGQEGLIIDTQSVDSIVRSVLWFIDNPDKIREMGMAARRMAEAYTWDAYSGKLPTLIRKTVK